jgi:2,3,4,5-tetrahydropyridine-2-carboxylate N-succinyltransferase
MPSFVNIGAHVGAGTMVDTWATVGSCAQIGAHCTCPAAPASVACWSRCRRHPTIIEDDCFIGARSEVVEGVVVGRTTA